MKKILSLFAIMTLICPLAKAEVILAPQWSEFCPPAYVKTEDGRFSSDKKYWYERRMQFNESLARCNGYTGEDLKSCYSQVREAEIAKNKVWDAKVQANIEAIDKMREDNRKTDQYNLLRDVVRMITD